MVSLGKDPTGIYATMISKNQITPVIETAKSINGSQTYLERNNYYLTGYGLAEPQSLEIQNGQYAVEPRIKYKTHNDRGDILTLGYVAGPDIGYQWGYNGQYPIAKASNAVGTEILFSSFDETGTWDSGLSAYDANFKRSGVYSGRIDNTNTSEKTSMNRTWLAVSLTAARKFHYAGWVYSNGPTADIYLLMKRAGETGYVTYADFATTSAIGKWTYLEKDFLVPADVTQMTLRVDNNGALNGGTQVWFDDVRLYPSDAQMTTYTFDPLVGITSTTDPKGEITYYEYDSFQRLKNIKDQYGNILKSYDYNYRP
jgi:YD repeat-containing protein